MDPIQAQIPAQAPGNPYNLVGDTAAQVQPQVQVTVQPVQIPVPPVPTVPVAGAQIPAAPAPAAPTEGFLEKIVKGIVRLIAKASGNADPLTGQSPVAPSTGNTQTPATPAASSTGIFGQIGGVFSGIAETAQGMVSGAVAGPQQAPAPTPMPPVPQMPPVQAVQQAPAQPAPQAPVQPVTPPTQ